MLLCHVHDVCVAFVIHIQLKGRIGRPVLGAWSMGGNEFVLYGNANRDRLYGGRAGQVEGWQRDADSNSNESIYLV